LTPPLPFSTHPRRWAQWLLRRIGWTLDLAPPPGPKMVLVMYPHTSNWDFIIGLIARFACGWPIHWLGKHSLFRPPLGGLFQTLGGIPVNRSNPGSLIDDLSDYCQSHTHAVIAIAPEGTRGHVAHWKTGFHRIARGASIPIALGYIDYGAKRIGIAGYLEASEDIDADMQRIAGFYENIRALRPEAAGTIVAAPRPPRQDPS
jgi:1-acyl-sn-glycerol-3-phosphate acyltransferase